jgi:uncharacterized delta-60 repeat protein
LQPDGKIVAAGSAIQSSGGVNFALARYDSGGNLDPAFGAGGKVTTDFAGSNDRAFAVALQPDGKIVAAGATIQNNSGISDFGLARYDAGGNLDPAFGTGGKVVTDFFRSFDEAYAVALQPDGKIIAAGVTVPAGLIGETVAPSINFALARYESTPACTLSITNASVDKPVLSPPDHRMVPVFVNYVLNHTCPASCALGVSSNEPVSGTSPGDLSPDWEIVKPNLVRLRAERADGGKGRVYTITITCRDSGGNVASEAVTVRVPRS